MKNFRFRRVWAVARKEISHIWRDPFTIGISIFLPMFLVGMFGYAIDLDIRDIRLAVFDYDNSQSSRILAQSFANSEYFHLEYFPNNVTPTEPISRELNKAALVIPVDFEKKVNTDRQGKAQILLDGSDNSIVGVILGYIGGVQLSASQKLGQEKFEPVHIESRYFFNPQLKSTWFIVPGLTVIVIALLSILMTALTIAREWENGSMELLLSTPIRPLEIVLGKLIPYMILALTGLVFVYLVARLAFEIPFQGSYWLFLLGSIIFINTNLAIGLLISVITRRQQIATQMSMLVGLLPSLFLSGFIFSIENMSTFFQWFTGIFPARWYMTICRGLFLKGSTFIDLYQPFIALLIMNIILIVVATKRFKGNLEV